MSASKRHSLDGGLKVKQTMFQFLKRKKHSDLQSSLKKNTYQNSASKVNVQKQYHSRAKSSLNNTIKFDDIVLEEPGTFRDTLHSYKNTNQTGHKYSKRALYNQSHVTPRKISFALDNELNNNYSHSKQSARKPLIQMISPLKNPNRSHYKSQTLSQEQKLNTSLSKEKSKKGILKSTVQSNKKGGALNDKETFVRRKLNSSIEALEHTFYEMINAGQQTKQKANLLGITLINLFKDIQKDLKSQRNLQRQFGQIKILLKQINTSVQVFSQAKGQTNMIENFHKGLSEHINSLQSTNNQYYDKRLQEEVNSIKSDMQYQINELLKEKSKGQRQIQKLQRKIQKIEIQYNNEKQSNQKRQQNLLQTMQNLKIKYQEEISTLKEQNVQISNDLNQQKFSIKQIQKRLKDELYQKQKASLQSLKHKIDEFSQRQTFLLSEIQKLKNQFSNDISKLHNLYQSKQQQLNKNIDNLRGQLDRQANQRKCDRQIADRILAEANSSRQHISDLKKKDQQMMRDLYRMNETLYQHWLALKDIKTLSERLNIFKSFDKIYCDLAFNSTLFVV